MKKRIISIICLILAISISLASCNFLEGGTPDGCTKHKDKNDDGVCDTVGCGKTYEDGCDKHRDANDDGICDIDGCAQSFTDGNERPSVNSQLTKEHTHADSDSDGKCDECGGVFTDGSAVYSLSLGIYRGVSYDLKDAVASVISAESARWDVDCEAIVTLEDGVMHAKKCGETTVRVTDGDGNACNVALKVSVYANDTGYDISAVNDANTYKVKSEYEANKLLDEAIFNHVYELKLDFSSFGSSYVAFTDYEIEYEFSSHVTVTKSYYENTPHLLTLKITYNSESATTYSEKTASNTFVAPVNGNALLRLDGEEGERAADFDGFAIYSHNAGKREVRNSEELWWALENNYLPTFPNEYTAAERYFEEAKTVLRKIIRNGMTDYEKLLAIYEYLIYAVEYDYDAYENMNQKNAKTDMCYYLEGVFERGRAVCDGKSKALVLFCRIEGIECVRDFGEGYSGIGHAWNYVKLDGKWYMVDTTDGDVKQYSHSGMGQFFGYGVEYTSYEPFLTNVSYHKAKYKYSTLFTPISGGASEKYPESVLDANPDGANYDFRVSADAELISLVKALVGSDIEGDVILLLVIDTSVAWNLAIDKALLEIGASVKYSAFVGEIDGESVNFLLFKNL